MNLYELMYSYEVKKLKLFKKTVFNAYELSLI
jgi:hypothetical protein